VEGAIAAYREVLRLTDSREAHARIGELLEKKSDKDGAIAEYRQVVGNSGDPGYYSETLTLLYLLTGKKEVDDVYSLAQRAVDRWSQANLAHFYLGWAMGEKKDVDGAIAQYREAIKLDPKDGMSHNNLGWELEQKGDRNGALQEYQAAAALDPKDPLYQKNVKRLSRSSIGQKN
jgi:tetratricopeptide (TPR) repeat protein